MDALHSLSARWPEVDRLLDEALALPVSDHAGWLARLEGDRAALRETLAKLLRAHAEAESADFMGTLPQVGLPAEAEVDGADDCDDGRDELAAGEAVGPYRLIQPLGRGGMGSVWLAERADGQFKRQVALKLPRLAGGRTVAERLARERDVLATLAHPHIARLYDAGVDARGRPWLAMEAVAGQRIDRWCDEHHSPVAERLRLLLQVCAAVAHAHAQLVVHRDLKPANILVTPEGDVRLLDFGIAKLLQGERTQETALTRLAGRAMTPDYAEQIRGEPLATASDVYSLGVVAFELLAGAPPYRLKRGSAAELEDAIVGTEPPLASALAAGQALKKTLRGDLDAILNRALKKNPAERYASVEALAADLRRHQQHEPVLARPDGRWYRTRRFVKRHRVAVALSSALLASVAGGGVLAAWLAFAASTERERAVDEVARQEAVRNLYLEATTSLSSAARGVGGAAALAEPHAVARLLEAKLRDRAPRYAQRPREWQALLEAVMLQLNYSSDFERSLVVGREYLAHLKQHGAEPALVILAHATLGGTLFQLQRLDESEAERRAGLAWASGARDPRSEEARLLIATDLGRLLLNRGKSSEGMTVLLAAETRAAERLPGHALRHVNQVTLAAAFFDHDDARALEIARRGREGLLAAVVADDDHHFDSLLTLALALEANGLAAQAEAALREALRHLDAQYPRDNRNRVRTLGRLAAALAHQGRHAEARQLLGEEIALLQTLGGPDGPAALATLRGRQVENEYLYGDTKAALAQVSADPVALLTLPGMRDADIYHGIECRVLADAGRVDEAVARAEALWRAWPARDVPSGAWLRLLALRAWALLLRGDAQTAASSARALHETLARGGSGGKARSDILATELLAQAHAQAGDREAARRELAALDSAPIRRNLVPILRAESALRRARAWHTLGETGRAAAAANLALEDLRSQHPESPRLREAGRLGAALR